MHMRHCMFFVKYLQIIHINYTHLNQKVEAGVDRVEKLLEFLTTRLKPQLLNFCGALQITNQNYVAQMLREECKCMAPFFLGT